MARWTLEQYAAWLAKRQGTPPLEPGRIVPVPAGVSLRVGKDATRLRAQALLMSQLALAGAPPPVTEYRFHPTRMWRADLAWPEQRLIVEYEGGVFTGGRHTRGRGFEDDVEKYNAAVLHGFRVLRATYDSVESGRALNEVLQALHS